MQYATKFLEAELRHIRTIISDHVVFDGASMQLAVSDSEMCEIIKQRGYDVNRKYVQRQRNYLEIKPRGTCSRKFTEAQLDRIQAIIRDYTIVTTDSWQLSVSDGAMAAILKERGFEVNTKFVERTRRSLGIEPLGKRGGARPGAGRPSQASNIIDPGYALVIANHYRDTYRLSDHQGPSGALSGLTGLDKHTPGFGYHTTDLETAQNRKDARLARLAQKAGSRKTTINTATTDTGCSNINDIERLFGEEIERRSSLYGRVTSQGGTRNTRTAQIFSSL